MTTSPASSLPISGTPPSALANPQIRFRCSSRQERFHRTLRESGVTDGVALVGVSARVAGI